jgi:hypothetical protein
MSSWRLPEKKALKFYFGDWLTSGQIWLIPLVYDDDSQSTYFTILGKKKKKKNTHHDDVDTESHKISS